ncbi:leucine-rich repeat-containing protein 24 [Orussus abietinus]|uniref:leucine-rich repeat-containing protein 24 n=1 Tax=Orussus abietinus TaxID=222816 RepID=UPI000626D1A7|nr:leucine-rich repeat-containing protein 24 [Orussus abietinus]
MCPSSSAWCRRILLGTVLSWVAAVQGCPSMCACKWKSGKEWVECANRDLKGLPQGAREETQVLDLSGNQLISLPAECFRALGLTNLQKLYLSRSRIGDVDGRAFVGLVGLVELDLSENLIDGVPSETFASYPSLMKLMLNGNPIREIRREAFRPLMHLTNLELRQCQLETVEQGAFNGLPSLEWLRMDGNKLTHVPDVTLPLGGNLHGLTLHNNPWACDCRLRSMQTWLKETAKPMPQESEPVCASPARLAGRQVKAVKLSDLACPPRIRLQERVEVYEGANVTLACDVHAVPPPETVTWWFNGETYETQAGNDTASSLARVRYNYKQRGPTNVTSMLHVYNLVPADEGTYTCAAENGAGASEANLSLRVLLQERPTEEPPADQPGTGYVAAVAAGALVGTLLALGCALGGLLLCTRRRSDRKRNAKPLVSPDKSATPGAKDPTSLSGKGNGELAFEHRQQQAGYRDRTAVLEHGGGLAEAVQGPPGTKYLTEPDLINEVPEAAESYGLYQHRRAECQLLEYDSRYTIHPDLRPALAQMSYLDQDGYPLNFGLPKIPFNGASTLPRRQRTLEGSAAAPAARYSREAEFLARTIPYEAVLPRSDTRYTAEGYPYPAGPPRQLQVSAAVSPMSPMSPMSPEAPFVPSPPAAYRGEPTPLSPRSLLGKTAREARADGLPLPPPLPPPPDHAESPDEGYVGDAMDV